MPTYIIRNMSGLMGAVSRMATKGFPLTLTWADGEPTRRDRQNRLAQKWFTDISSQRGDMTHEGVRAMCKLHFGVPILRAENPAFCASYDRVMKHMPYEDKLAAIKAFDMPVTRLMTVKQMTEFMDETSRYWTAQGVRLTDPIDLRYEVME